VKPSAKIWYAASVLLAFKLERGKQARLPVWENVYLIQANSPAEARKRAEALGRAEAGQEVVELEGKPARVVFAGVRKILTCAANPARPGPSTVSKLHDGMEANLRKLVRGEAVSVVYEE